MPGTTMRMNKEKMMQRVKSFYKENSSFFDYEHEIYKPPVRITEVGTSHWGPGDSYTTKKRQYFAINLVTKGSFSFQQRAYDALVKPGQVFLNHLNQQQSFAATSKGFATKRFILFGGELLNAHLTATRLVEHDVITPASPKKMLGLFRKAYKTIREKREGFVEELMILTQQIFLELGRSVVGNYPAELNRGIAFVHRNLHRTIRLEEITDSMQVSVRHCVRLFNTYLKMPPIQFVHQEKNKWAENLLQRSNLSIKEVALLIGYDDPFYFSNRFKKFSGVSPSKFRNIGSENLR